MYKKIIKPTTDIVLSLCIVVFLSPLLFVLSLSSFFSNKGTPFFVQERPGKNGKIFKIIKFKTMRDEMFQNGKPLTDYERLTFVGKIIRKTSLDELPQLFNVIKGDMSLVGPRPLLPEYLPLYSKIQQKRHDVKPGITGWAQVNGRNALSWEEKFFYDVEYVENVSLKMDAKIVMITIDKVVKRHGVNANNYMTMEAFKGTIA